MRRSGLCFVFPLVLLIAGCGGSTSRDGSRAVLQLDNGHGGQLGAGVDASGNPVLINYKGNGDLSVVTLSGTKRIVVPGVIVDRFPYVLGNFLLVPGYQTGVDGTLIVNLREGSSRYDAGEYPSAFEGERVVWGPTALDANPPSFVLEDLGTGARTPLALPDLDIVNAISGNRLIVGKLTGTAAEGTSPVYQYRLVSLDGATSIPLAGLTSAPASVPWFLDANGEALGSDSGGHVVIWNTSGIPTLLTKVQGTPLGLWSDGRALVLNSETNKVDVVQGGQVSGHGPHVDAQSGAFSTGCEHFVFVDGPSRVAAYRVQ